MRKDQKLGLDELMIVNPSSSGAEAMFLSEDGTLYQMQSHEENTRQGMGQYFLSGDGSLYQVQGFDAGSSAESTKNSGKDLEQQEGREIGQYFLGSDGMLYEIVR